MEIAQIIDEALFRYYSGQGKTVPKWKTKKDPDWWTEYLKELGIDRRNTLVLCLHLLSLHC